MISVYLIQFLIFTTVLAISAYIFRRKRPKNFPPGPFPLPVIGNLHQIGLEPHKAFLKMGNHYGSVFSVNMGNFQCVVLNDSKAIKEALSNYTFADRPKMKGFVDRTDGVELGLSFNSGRGSIEQRRFTMRTLRDFGFGRNSMEGMIQQEIKELVEMFAAKVGQPFLMKHAFNGAVLNSLWHITTGERYDHNDPYFRKVVHSISEAMSEAGSMAGAYNFFPILAHLFPNWSGYNHMLNIFKSANEIVSTALKKRQPFKEGDGEPRDFVDAYHLEISKEKDPHSSFFGKFGEKNLVVTLEDLFLGGTETTSTALQWVFFLLAHNPNEQDKLHAEIQAVVGNSRLPKLADQESMPYAEAVIMEVLRFSTIVPLAIPHCTTQDVYFRGYFIPKDTVVFPNVYAASHDENVWKNPGSFWPNRFILPGGALDRNNESFIIFSYGKRQCPGERLARDEIFLFTTTLFQKFKVSFDKNRPIPDMHEAVVGVTNSPKPHYVILEEI